MCLLCGVTVPARLDDAAHYYILSAQAGWLCSSYIYDIYLVVQLQYCSFALLAELFLCECLANTACRNQIAFFPSKDGSSVPRVGYTLWQANPVKSRRAPAFGMTMTVYDLKGNVTG